LFATRRPLAVAAWALIPVAAAVTVGLSLSSPAGAVANGTPAQEGQYRFAVKLTMTHIPRPDGSFYDSGCSGALIAPQWIITAGHCFHDVNRHPVSGPVPYSTVAAFARVDDSSPNGHVITVVEDYQSPSNDVAIAKLATPVYDVVPVLPRLSAPTAGEVLRIAGWGATDSVDPHPSTHLNTGQVTVSTVNATEVGVVGRAPHPDTSACLYDSGAPYFSERIPGLAQLVGIESEGPDCPHSQVETTGRTDILWRWISTTMFQHRGAPPARPARVG
jgi:secreted trypsin-like serine protease